MLSLTIFLLVTQIINACYSTRLPLEVYELTPNAAGGNDLKHKNLEYSTINGQQPLHQHFLATGSSSHGHPEQPEFKMLSSSDSKATTLTQTSSMAASSSSSSSASATTTTTTTNQLDRRRSRQMLDIMQKSHHDQTGNHKLPTSSASGAAGANNNAAGGGSINNGSPKDVRILYQVGVSIPNHTEKRITITKIYHCFNNKMLLICVYFISLFFPFLIKKRSI